MVGDKKGYTTYYEVSLEDLPFHCPPQDSEQWNSHPRVFLNLLKQGSANCPYCGTEYVLKQQQSDNND